MAKRQRRRRDERRKEHAKREGWKTRHSVITGAGLVAGAIGVGPAAAHAAYFYVGSTGDTGGSNASCSNPANTDCTLRQALVATNTDAGFDYIYFNSGLSGTITLGDYLLVTNPVGIYGPNLDNPSQLTVSGDDNSGIFNIDVTNPGAFVGISSLRLADGSQLLGGAIFNLDSELGIFNSILTGNEAGYGGAIYESGDYDDGYNTRVAYSTLTGNEAGFGGAITGKYSFGSLSESTVTGNDAYAVGGVFGGFGGDGGGRVFDSTISGNNATYTGGLAADYVAPFYNSILANNSGAPYSDVYSAYLYGIASLIRTPGAVPVYGLYNLTGVDPLLGGLADNGGPTPNLRPAFNSPVVDAGYSESFTDQRFSTRPIDIPGRPNRIPGFYGAADIGSVELTVAEGTAPASPPAPQPVAKKKCKKKKKKKNHAAQSAKKKKCKKKKKKRAAAVMTRRALHAHDSAGPLLERAQRRSDWADGAWRTNR
jgi:hypothetical protein